MVDGSTWEAECLNFDPRNVLTSTMDLGDLIGGMFFGPHFYRYSKEKTDGRSAYGRWDHLQTTRANVLNR